MTWTLQTPPRTLLFLKYKQSSNLRTNFKCYCRFATRTNNAKWPTEL